MSERVPTMHDVARAAGVSTATVSRVLNGGQVRPDTARRVRRAMGRLGYVPNRVARGLVTGRSDVVGVLVPDLVGPLNAAVARGVEDALEARGMHAVVMTDHRDAERERDRLETLVARRVDGFVLIGSELSDDEIEGLVGATPVAHVGAERERDRLPEVRVDNAAGIEAVLALLAEAGHRRLAHLGGPRRDGRERLAALYERAPVHGLEVTTVVDAAFSEEGGLRAGRELLDRRGFDAVLCANDRSAVGLYAAARERGVRIPDDVSVVGFDDLPWSGYLAPPLTTLRQPSREMGRLAAERILEPDGDAAWHGVRALAPEVVVRASTARAPPADPRADGRDSDAVRPATPRPSAQGGRTVKRILVTLVALACSVAFAQLRMWTTQVQPERMDVQEALVADFEAETGISVEVIPVEESELATRITAAFSAGDLPDVLYHPVSQTIGWAEAGILDVDAASATIEALGEGTFARGLLDLVETPNGYAAVPSDGWTQLLVYRADLFEQAGLEPPTSFEAIRAAIDALHDPPDRFGFVAATDPNNDYMMQVLEHFFLANGVQLVNDDGSIGFAAEPTVRTLEFYDALVDASPDGNLFWQQSRELYFDGRAAMIVWSPFILDELAGLRDSVPVTASDDPTSRELAANTGIVTRLAGPDNPDGAGWAASSNWGITVDADTEAAQTFVEWVLSGDGYLTWLSMAPEGLFPARSGTTDDPAAFVDGWSQLDVGVDRRAPLSALYGQGVIDDIVEGLQVANRWAYAQGEGALLSRLYGTRVMAELVRSYTDGERSAEETAELLQQRVSALR